VAGAADGQTPIAGLLRIAWDTVGRIVARVIADMLDERRLDGLVCIGVDEIAYRRAHRYLTSVADHRTGAMVWCRPGRNSATLAEFFAELGPRKHSIRAVSIDMSGAYQRAIRDAVPDAQICFDPFHVVRLAARATDQVRRDECNAHERSHTPAGRWVKGTRRSLLKAPERQTVAQLATLYEVQHANRALYRAFLLREELATTCPTPRSRRRTSTPGSPGPATPDSGRSSGSRARSQRTATASSPRSASVSPTAASRPSTARSA
jgi:transposase